MSKEKLHLPKLVEDDSNWIMYHDRMQWTMKMRGLGDHLTDTAVTKSYTDAGDVGGLTPTQRWAKDEVKASWLLDATIPDELFHKVKDTANVKEVWDKLKGEFEGKSRSVLVDLGRKFQMTRCSEDDDVRAYFSKLAHLREKLSALGRSVSDNEYIAVLIGSLPSCYDGPIDSLTSSCDVNNVDITPTAVTWAAIQEYEKRSLRKENKIQEEAFAAAEAEKNRSARRDIKCFNCKRKGHYKSECWAKGGGNEGGGPKNPRGKEQSKTKDGKDTANAAETESSEDESWAVIVEIDDAPSKGEHLAITASAAPIKSESVSCTDDAWCISLVPLSDYMTWEPLVTCPLSNIASLTSDPSHLAPSSPPTITPSTPLAWAISESMFQMAPHQPPSP